jgi:hypothetical protein
MKRLILGAFALTALCAWAAGELQPIKAKLGLWEVTTTRQTQGMPAAQTPQIPADKLAQLPPAQRAQIEAMLKQRSAASGGTRTRQTCVTPEKLNGGAFGEDKKSCQRTIVRSTSSLVEIHEECVQSDGSKAIGDVHYEVIGGDTMKGSVKLKMTVAGHEMNSTLDLSGKWIGADCGSVK